MNGSPSSEESDPSKALSEFEQGFIRPGLPRGPLWNRAATERPWWSVPFTRAGRLLSAPANVTSSVFREQVRPDVNGLRIHWVNYGSSTGGAPVFSFRKNGEDYDPWYGNLPYAGGTGVFLNLDAFMIYLPGDWFEFSIKNDVSIRHALFIARGWYF